MDPLWFKDAITYVIDVERFYDGNGDGIGDFQGLSEKLDYLAALGVTCLWILPFFPSPRRDNRYDISDYYHVAPELGTEADFVEFIHLAGERGMRVLLDLVMNHTSNEHPWFQAARHDPHSRFRDYYIWSNSPPSVPPGKGPIFPEQEDSVWTWDEVARAYYHHRFYHFQPDLDASNPEVREEIERTLDFWLSFGVDGFRIDAASHMVDEAVQYGQEYIAPHRILREIRQSVCARHPGAVLLGEADVEPEDLVAYFGDGDELTLLFNFVLNNYLWLALARREATPIARVLNQLPAVPEGCGWANFLRNLDELDLERLTENDREEVYAAFAPEQRMRIYGRGIRRRLAPMLGGDRRRIELAQSLLFSLPGMPVIVYGDEIGLGEDLDQPERSAVRPPMAWSGRRNGGFSDAGRSQLVQLPIDDAPFSYHQTNVEAQQDDPDSLLNWMRELIRTRRMCPEFGRGFWHIFPIETPGVLAHRCAWKGGIVVAMHNLTDQTQRFDIDIRDQRGRELQHIFGHHHTEPLRDGIYHAELAPYGYRWCRVIGARGEHV